MSKKPNPINRSDRMIRTSFSISQDKYDLLNDRSKDLKVSLSWVIRDAIDLYVDSLKTEVIEK